MKFVSVNGNSPPAPIDDVIMESIAPDGGLYVPETLPLLSSEFLEAYRDQSLRDVGLVVSSFFFDDVPRTDLDEIVRRAWDFPIPLKHLANNLYLLELFHGPTLAFKDVGARFMSQLLSCLLAKNNERISILVATSGDTGSAVAHGFYNVP